MKRLRIYLSSTFEDLKSYRAAVFAALERAGFDVARMEAYAAADRRPLDICLRDVEQSDTYVGLFAWRYGYEPPETHGNPDGKSITELEYRHAEIKKLHKLVFFAHRDTKNQWPDQFKDELTGHGGRGEKIKNLRTELGTEKSAGFFRTPDELATLVLAAIMRSGLSGRPYNIPPIPANFIPRSDLTNALVDLLTGATAGARWRHTIVQGIGGIGKTTLAINACNLPEIVNAFPDGLLWTSLGERSNLARSMTDLYILATGNTPAVEGADALSQALGEALDGRNCLLIIDDVWHAEDLQYFLQIKGPQLLVTTRIRNLVEQTGHTSWSEVQVSEMETEEAVALLGRGLLLNDTSREMLSTLAEHLGYWPLLMELVNARLLEEKKTRRGTFEECIDHVVKLFQRRGVLSFDRRNSKARNTAVARSVEVGLEFIEKGFPGITDKATWLSIFPEDTPIPVRVLADLWNMQDIDLEEEVARPLDSISILRWDRHANEVRLHDMIQCALVENLTEPDVVHRKLIDAWQDPYRLPHDYAWRWFGWHCTRANEQTRLHQLLLDFDWLHAKLTATEINALIGEFDQIGDDRLASLLQDACRRSAYVLARDKAQLAGQLLARIPEREKELRDSIQQRALLAGEPWLRPLTASLASEHSIRWLRPSQAETLDSVVFSPNGLWAAHASGTFGTAPGNIVLWDLVEWRSRGPCFQTLPKLNPFAMALSDDARWCLYADSVGGVHRLDASGGEPWKGHAHEDLSIAKLLAISADGRRALSACTRGRLVAWDIDAGHHEIIYDDCDNRIEALFLDKSGNSAIVARRDGSIDLWDLCPARQWTLFKLNSQPCALARSRDSTIVAVATVDGRIEVREIASRESPIGPFMTQEKPTSLALSFDCRYLAVGTDKGNVEVWNIEHRTQSVQYCGAHTYEVTGLVFSQDSTRVVSADLLQIKDWTIGTARKEKPESAGPYATGPVKVTADGLRAVAVLKDGRLGVWDMHTGALEKALPRAPGPAFGDAGNEPPDGLVLATKAPYVLSWNKKLLCVWDLESKADVKSLEVTNTRDAAITPDGKGVVYLDDLAVSYWTPGDGKSRILGIYDDDPPGYVIVSPDGQSALSSGGHREVFEWRLDATYDPMPIIAQKFGTFLPSNSWWPDSRDKPSTIAFAGTEKAIVTTGDGSLFMLFTKEQKPEEYALHGSLSKFADRHESFVHSLLLTNDGQFIVTSSYDGKIIKWDLGSCQPIAVFNAGNVRTIEQLSRSAQHALLYTSDGVLQIVSLRDGSLVAAFQGDKQITTSAADAELRWVVARDQGGQMHFFHVESRT